MSPPVKVSNPKQQTRFQHLDLPDIATRHDMRLSHSCISSVTDMVENRNINTVKAYANDVSCYPNFYSPTLFMGFDCRFVRIDGAPTHIKDKK